MFDSRPEAEAAKARLNASNIDADRVRIIDKSSTGSNSYSAGTGDSPVGEGQGFWSSLKDMFVPDEDRHSYAEGIDRGGFLLCAEVDEDEADRAVSLLEESDSVDFEQREQSWRSEGWSGQYSGASTRWLHRHRRGDDRQPDRKQSGRQPVLRRPDDGHHRPVLRRPDDGHYQ
jgi:hypothetical protein